MPEMMRRWWYLVNAAGSGSGNGPLLAAGNSQWIADLESAGPDRARVTNRMLSSGAGLTLAIISLWIEESPRTEEEIIAQLQAQFG